MAIDIRATVTCSLGTLISGSLSDDYLQGSGLVKYRGSCEISGLITPAAGTVVTFSYVKGNVTSSIPRKLRVLSSFADPFRRTTKVELGCKLTYLSDYRPAPTVDGEPSVETGKRQQCLNGYIDWPANSEYGVPISAAGLLTTCCTRLGIAASTNPLTNKYYRDTFDFSPGYVSVLNDLLVSESYFGYLDSSEVLQIVSLDQDGGIGPVITQSDIVDLSSIGTGQLPGDAVVVRYDSMKLNQDLEGASEEILEERNWVTTETVEDEVSTDVRYTADDGEVYTNVYRYIPYTKNLKEYGEDKSWSDTTCVLVTTQEEGADLSNSVIKSTTTIHVQKAQEANDYCAKLLSAGFNPLASITSEVVETVEYEYDKNGQVIQQVTTRKEPFFMWAGRLNFDYIFDNGAITLGTVPVVVRREIVTIETLYAELPNIAQIKKRLQDGETYESLVNGQRTITKVYQNWALTQQGQQGIAAWRENASFADADNAANYLNAVSRNLVLSDTQVETSNGRILVGFARRPPVQLRMGLNGANYRGEFTSELLYTDGSPIGKRIIELSMPLQSDDYYSSKGRIVKGDAEAKANRYGRVQNRLLLGNRSGINVQVAPERLPAAPFSPLYIQANGLTALYRSNGNQWAFDSNGIVCSTDALFWGAVGGTGTFWFPVAPGITTLPTTPAVVDGTMNATSVVPPYNETAVYDARVTVGTVVTKFNYALELLTEVPALRLRTQVDVRRIRKVEVPAAGVSVAPLLPKVSSGGSVKPPLVLIALTSEAPAVASGGSVAVPLSSVGLAALLPQSVGAIKTQVFVPSANLTLSALTPVVTSGASVTIPAKDFSVTGNNITISRSTPSYQATGSPSSGANTFSIFWPSHQTNDIGIIVIEGSGDATAISPPSGWNAFPSTPVVDVANTSGSSLWVWWRRAASGSEGSVSIPDSGDHQTAVLFTIRGCVTTGDPWDVTTTGFKDVASTTATVPSVTTSKFATRVLMVVGRPDDSSSASHFSSPTNANLTSLTEHYEYGTVSGNGGGFVILSGVLADKNTTGATTITKASSTTDTYFVAAMTSY